MVVLCTASFIAVADTTIVSIALPSMRQALEFSTPGLQWVLNAYALTFGGMLLLCAASGTSTADGDCSPTVWLCSPWDHYWAVSPGNQPH